ncbi:MAG: TonB-dependent receptor domain-containing protein [Alkalispirochaeta sp.]
MMIRRRLLFGVLVLLMMGAGLSLVPAQSNRGEVQIYIFSETGEPLEGVEVRLEDEEIESDENGLINFVHPPGSHEFDLYYQGEQVATVEMSVRQGSVTEAIITAGGSDSLDESSRTDREDQGEEPEFDPDADPGVLSGTVTEIEDGEAVAGATIVLRGIDREVTTDEEGRFEIEVPEGLHTFSVIDPDFSTQTISEVEVAADRETVVDVELTPQAVALAEQAVFAVEEVRVEGGIAKLIEEMADTDSVVSFIGQEQIGRTGDSDAAGALRRVTGLTVVDGRFIYVRGMGERYSTSYLNGAILPSPEVDKRVVPLDLFPAGIIESLSVQKTYSPELPGQFGGGGVGITTIGLPDDQYRRRLRTDVSFSLGYKTGVSLEDRLFDRGGSLDFLGFDDGTRALPDAIDESTELIGPVSSVDFSGYTDEELEEFGESFTNPWTPAVRSIPLDYSGSISVRDKIELTDTRSFGFTASVSLKDSWDASAEGLTIYENANDPDVLGRAQHDYDVERTTRDVDLGGLVELVLEDARRYRIESASLLVRATDAMTEELSGFYGSESYDIRETEVLWREQTLFNQALRGRHQLAGLGGTAFRWNYNLSLARSYEPDRKYYIYKEDDNDGDFVAEESYLVSDDWSNRRVFTEVDDTVHDGGVAASVPIGWFGNPSADFLDFGSQVSYQARSSDTRRFGFDYGDANENREIVERDMDSMINDDTIGPIFDFEEYTEATDSISSDQLVVAGHAKADVIVFGNSRLSTGLRAEWSRQSVTPYDLFSREEEEPYELTPETVLDMLMPAINLTVPTGDESQVRLGASSTVNRPDLNELSPQNKYSGAPGAGTFKGNPLLSIARLYNADARWEWYLAEREFLSVGGFYKYFSDPIESFRLNSGGGEAVSTLANIPSAQNLGGELEWQLSGRYIGDAIRGSVVNIRADSFEQTMRRRKLVGGIASVFRDMTLSGNFAYIWSRINLGEDGESFQFELVSPRTGQAELKSFANTSSERPLEGQSPYVLNLSLGYRNSVSWSQDREQHTSAFFNYNVFGPRIVAIGTNGVPDIYEQPFHSLNFVLNQSLSEYISLGFSADNLLNPPAETTLSDERLADDSNVVESLRKGRSYSVSVKLSF